MTSYWTRLISSVFFDPAFLYRIFQATRFQGEFISWVCGDTNTGTSKHLVIFTGYFQQPKFMENLFLESSSNTLLLQTTVSILHGILL